jgi:hypothetical protein
MANVNCPPTIVNASQVSITLPSGTGRMVVEPDPVTVYMKQSPTQPGQVCWAVQNLQAGQTLHIAPKSGQTNLFPDRETTIVYPNTFATSGRPANEGSWQYSLYVTDGTKGGQSLYLTDPEILVEGGG